MSDPYSRESGVLHNNFDIDNAEVLQDLESKLSAERLFELQSGLVRLEPTFDRTHLQAIHKHIFQDIYPWAGKTRDQTFEIDNVNYTPINISKGESTFLPHNFIDNGIHDALKHIENRDALNTVHGFAENAGKTLGELNFVHAAREGNGRTQRSFVSSLGNELGHHVNFTVISRERNLQASISVFKDPNASDLQDLLLDATDPQRQDALRTTFGALERDGHDPHEFNVRTGKVGEELTGPIFARDNDVASVVQDDGQVIVIDQLDIPEGYDGESMFEVQRDLSDLASPERQEDLLKQQNSQKPPENGDDLVQ